MKEILLSNGKHVKVDENVFELVNAYKWYQGGNSKKQKYYAMRIFNQTTIYMHRFIYENVTKTKLNQQEEIDHINGDTFDNRISNLRVSTRSQNMANMKHHIKSRSKYRGIHFRVNYKNKWQAKLTYERKNIYLGYFKTEIEAAIQYDLGATYFFEKFAKLNFPERKQEYIEKIKSGYDPIYKRTSKKAKYYGVYQGEYGKWIAKPKGKYIGSFDTEEEAHNAVEKYLK